MKNENMGGWNSFTEHTIGTKTMTIMVKDIVVCAASYIHIRDVKS